ncbi:hypothetical protein PRUPE_2G249600 [Prunus persica]|uniref:Uncharacterized protein n=1 Tax=Prunus persica TaxID=3760 RepID=A0A251QLB9_PRUPE|nr:hypothetical protein PRUPE_2G249600 [Prunus persica]
MSATFHHIGLNINTNFKKRKNLTWAIAQVVHSRGPSLLWIIIRVCLSLSSTLFMDLCVRSTNNILLPPRLLSPWKNIPCSHSPKWKNPRRRSPKTKRCAYIYIFCNLASTHVSSYHHNFSIPIPISLYLTKKHPLGPKNP